MDVSGLLDSIYAHPGYAGQLQHVELLPERVASFGETARPLPPDLVRLLSGQGVQRLYTHQVAAIEGARRGQDCVVVTGTASGKTLCYNVPILETCLSDPEARALYLFPTKALAQDQFQGLLNLVADEPTCAAKIRPGVYDGDTPPAQRRRIKAEANLVLSNPDMVHASLLPYHPKWARFFEQLKFIVLDEVHTYRGILGANVACVLRRLKRICQHYGSEPVFLAASATIANPGELTARLIGRDVQVVDNDGAPRGRKYFALWNPAPPAKDSLARRSAHDEAVWLMVEAMQANGQCLAFTRTRQAAELVQRYVQDELRLRRSDLAEAVRAYRGGYLPHERRQIEEDLFNGKLRGVASTNALELGIDIGSLDVTLLVNYPGTIASTWQQAGRSGRRHDESLTVLIAGNDPVDQYLLRHPQYFFGQTPENAVVDPENPYVLANHLQAAAFELPLEENDIGRFGPLAPAIADLLSETQQLTTVDGKFYFSGGQNPAQQFSLRHMSDDTFSIVLVRQKRPPGLPDRLPRSPLPSRRAAYQTKTGSTPRHLLEQGFEVIANVDEISAPELVYPEAVYLHNGETYFVRELDLEGKVAYVERHEMDYYTQAILESKVLITDPLEHSDRLPTAGLHYGEVDVSWKTVAFKKIKFETRENIGYGTVDIPAQNLPTTAFWLVPNDEVRAALKSQKLRVSEGLCGLRNLAVVALPMVAMCDSRDVSGVVDSQNLGTSAMILYDRYPGGLGYAEKGYQQIDVLLTICHEMVSLCDCVDGCPSCVGLPNLRPAIHSDPDLMRGYPIPDKQATQVLLENLRALPSPTTVHALPASLALMPFPMDAVQPMLSADLRYRLKRRLRTESASTRSPEDATPFPTRTWIGDRVDLSVGQETTNDQGRHWLIEKPLRRIWPASTEYLATWDREVAQRADVDGFNDDLARLRSQLRQTVFLDLETCGFAGSMIFLVGLLYHGPRGPVLAQLWARNYAEEPAVLTTLQQILQDPTMLATFNGKSFDWPQVCDRHTLHTRSTRRALPQLIHVDLLHHARRRWKAELPNCKLQTLERFICGRQRVGDIPGNQIPAAYHRYVQTGDATSVRSILHHNALDLVTLLQLSLVLTRGR